jgi:chemotaxis protein CheX
MFDDELVTIFDTIAVMLLGAELHVAPIPVDAFERRSFTACIDFSGSFQGRLSATFGESLARRIAGQMLCLPPAEVSETDLRDAVGELVNIAAGNLKGVLPEHCRLSLPVVHVGGPLAASHVATVGKAMLEIFDEPIFVEFSGHARDGSAA